MRWKRENQSEQARAGRKNGKENEKYFFVKIFNYMIFMFRWSFVEVLFP